MFDTTISPKTKAGVSVVAGVVGVLLLKSSVFGLVVVGIAGAAAGYNARGSHQKSE